MKKQKNFYIHFKKLKRWTKNIIQDVRLQYFLKKTFRRKEGNFRSIRKSEEIKIPGLR